MGLNLDMKTTGALVIFVCVLLAYTAQTELAQHVQQKQGYRKPYFLLWMTHSGYFLILPLHLSALRILSISIPDSFSVLRGVLRIQFAAEPTPVERPPYGRSPSSHGNGTGESRPPNPRRASLKRLLGNSERAQRKLWKWRMGRMVVKLTLLIAFPALTWYAAVPLTSMTNITAIYNVFAFWAYLLAIRFLGEEPSRWKLLSVLLAVCGVFTIAYGDSISSSPSEGDEGSDPIDTRGRLLGNLLALIGSISYAWYEVWYKLHAALPSSSEYDEDDDNTVEDEVDALLASDEVDDVLPTPDASGIVLPSHTTPPPPATSILSVATSFTLSREVTHPSPATFLLHANCITAMIGACTFSLLWIPIPFLHWIGWELFELPPRESWGPIVGIILGGVVFNAGFMILLSLWGPVVASVGNLCTLVLVAIADMVLTPTGRGLSNWTLGGSAMVCAAFAMLVAGAVRGDGGGH